MTPASTLRTLCLALTTTSLACAQWVQQAPATSPSARVAAAMDFVPANGGLVLFGGSGTLLSSETWTYDGTNWTLLAPVTSPTARFGAQLVYDSARGVAVLYGGLASPISVPPPNSDTWEWDGTNWTLAAPVATAGNRYRYGACYDSLRGRVVIYGGATTQLLTVPNSQTWEYQGTTWTQVTTSGNPGPRERPAMCFHAGIGKAVLFGGSNGSSLVDETWLYDGVAGTWTQVAITGPKPSPRNGATLAFDALHGLCVLTGGQGAAGSLADTWTFDGATWTQQPTTTQAVRDHVMAALPTTGQVVKFGGFVAAPNTLSNETWEIGSGIYGSGCAGTSGVPSLVATGAPQIGQGWTANVTNLNASFNLTFLVFGLTKLPGIDLTALLGMPGCPAFASADLLLSATGSGGAASWTWPSVAGPLGASFYTQALCLDPPANGFGFTVSNAVYATLRN